MPAPITPAAAECPAPAASPSPSNDWQVDDRLTIIAIAIIAYVVADVFHEGVGHGGACLLVGGRALALSTVHFECSVDLRLVAAGGTIVNFILGFAAWLTAKHVYGPRLRYFLWLSMAVNLFEAGGYFLFSGIGNIGDWAVVIAGLEPAWLWRVGLTVLGAGTYVAFVWLALSELCPFVGDALAERVPCARRLCLTPYLAGGILSCVAGLLNPVGMILVALSAAASSLGGTSGLAWMWQLFENPRLVTPPRTVPPIGRSGAWLAAGAILALIFIAVLGPGITFRR